MYSDPIYYSDVSYEQENLLQVSLKLYNYERINGTDTLAPLFNEEIIIFNKMGDQGNQWHTSTSIINSDNLFNKQSITQAQKDIIDNQYEIVFELIFYGKTPNVSTTAYKGDIAIDLSLIHI